MRALVLIGFLLIVSVSAFVEVQTNYHDSVGIPEAERIRLLEEALAKNDVAELEPQDNRIVGGVLAPANAHPYFAGLLVSFTHTTSRSVCGATLLSPNRLVTAAHCWFDGARQAWQFLVILGSTQLYTGGERIPTSQVIMHPQYFPPLLTNDVAMIYLPWNANINALVRPIRLPQGSELWNQFVGHQAVAAGFGATNDQIQQASTVVSHVSLQVISQTQCDVFTAGFVTASTICTSGAGGVGICGGDSGGPLITYDNNGEPFLAGLLIYLWSHQSVCGASLLSANRLVTAAHCWFDGTHQAWQFEVILGSNFLYSGGERIFSNRVVMHPNYFPRFLTNDIAMIYLPRNAHVNYFTVSPIRLPTQSEAWSTFEREWAVAAGFGKTNDHQQGASTIVSHVSLQVINNQQCAQLLQTNDFVTFSTLCTSGDGIVGICGGDSGGPLVAYGRDGQPFLIGISSFAVTNGCQRRLPSGFARVTSFLNFINQHM